MWRLATSECCLHTPNDNVNVGWKWVCVCEKPSMSPRLSETELTHSPVTRKYAEFPKMAEQGPMAIAMRLRNQLQNVYKLDPLRNEVSERGDKGFCVRLLPRASRTYYKRAWEGRSVWRERREMERETVLRVCAGVSVAKNQSTVCLAAVVFLFSSVAVVFLSNPSHSNPLLFSFSPISKIQYTNKKGCLRSWTNSGGGCRRVLSCDIPHDYWCALAQTRTSAWSASACIFRQYVSLLNISDRKCTCTLEFVGRKVTRKVHMRGHGVIFLPQHRVLVEFSGLKSSQWLILNYQYSFRRYSGLFSRSQARFFTNESDTWLAEKWKVRASAAPHEGARM